MTDCPHGQQRHKCETCEVIAERDQLRARQALLIDAVRRLLDLDEQRVAVILETAPHDMEEGITRTVPIWRQQKLVTLELRKLLEGYEAPD